MVSMLLLTLLAVNPMTIPLTEGDGWTHPPFEDHKTNSVTFDKSGLTITVDDSSSPLFYKFPQALNVSNIALDGHALGLPKVEAQTEGEKGSDDFALRVGLVSPGPRPNWLKRLFLPKWIRMLLELDASQGFSHVSFYNVSRFLPTGERRPHATLKNISEKIVLQMKMSGNFGFSHDISPPVQAYALWVHSDGDETHSTFTINVKKLVLRTEPSNE